MNSKTAVNIMLCSIVAIILFHLLIFFKVVPYEITWGGRLKNDAEMYVFEAISIGLNLVLLSTLLMKGVYIKAFMPEKIINLILWIFLILFALNTVGNIIAVTNFEKFFALVTLAFVVLIWVILRKEKTNS